MSSSSVDLFMASITIVIGGIAIYYGEIGLGLIILALGGFGAYSTIVEILEGR